MKYFIFVCLLTAVIAAENGTTVEKKIDPEPPKTSSTSSPSTPTTKPTDPTTSTIIPPTTQSTAETTPSTPTTPPTSSAPSTTKTTPTEKPTTTAAPQPSPKPNPPPVKPVNPEVGHWMKNYSGSVESCVVFSAAIQIQFPYNATVNGSLVLAQGWINVPPNAVVEGNCTGSNDSLTLVWNNTNPNVTANKIVISFKEIKAKYDVDSISVQLNPNTTNPIITDTNVINLNRTNHSDFSTSLSKSYKCDKEQSLNLTSINGVGHVVFWHTHFQAFSNSTSGNFQSAEDCEPITSSDVVPLAVGCALAALVIIVLVAYLVGRKRAQARGYLSM